MDTHDALEQQENLYIRVLKGHHVNQNEMEHQLKLVSALLAQASSFTNNYLRAKKRKEIDFSTSTVKSRFCLFVTESRS